MSYLLEAMLVILGIMGIFAHRDIFEVLGCFAVAALFNIAGNIINSRRGK